MLRAKKGGMTNDRIINAVSDSVQVGFLSLREPHFIWFASFENSINYVA